jgi:hypothetical protein
MRVALFFPFQTSCYLNGHSFIEQELNGAQIGFGKTDNAFLAVDDVAAGYIAFAVVPICGHDRGPQLVVMRSP